MITARLVFSVIASLPVAYSFCLYMSRFDVVNSYAFIGMATLLLYLYMTQYAQKNLKIVMMLFYGPVLLAVYTLILHGDPTLILSLGTGYLLLSPILMFLSSLSESPRGMLTSYLFAYITSLLILEAVMAGATTPHMLFIQLVGLLVATISGRVVPFYPLAGFGTAVGLLVMPTALGAVGLAFLAASSHKAFNLRLHDYTGMVKAVILSIALTSIIAVLSMGNPSTVSLLIAALALVLTVIVFKVSRSA